MNIIKKVRQVCGVISMIAILCMASNVHGLYLKGDKTYDSMKYKIKLWTALSNSSYDKIKPRVQGFALGVGKEFGDNMRADISFNNTYRRQSDSFDFSSPISEGFNSTSIFGTPITTILGVIPPYEPLKVSMKKSSVAVNMYKDILKRNMFRLQLMGSLDWGRFKPILSGHILINGLPGEMYFTEKLATQNSVVGSIGISSLFALNKYISIEAAGKVGRAFGRKAAQVTINSFPANVTLKPGVNYGVYAGLIFNL